MVQLHRYSAVQELFPQLTLKGVNRGYGGGRDGHGGHSGRFESLFELKATITCGKRPYFGDCTDASRIKKRVESPNSPFPIVLVVVIGADSK